MAQPMTVVDEIRNLRPDAVRELVDSLPVLAWTCNADGSELFLSQQWARYTGLSLAQLRDAQQVPFHVEDRDWVSEWYAALAKGDEFTTPDFRVRRRDGTYRWFHARAIPIMGADGNVRRWYGVTLDIDEIRTAREHARQLNADLECRIKQRTAELVAANRELESFAYAVSHDLRAPLRAISGYCELLRASAGHLLPPEAGENLERIARSNLRMNDLIEGLLVLSRCKQEELRVEVVDLSALTTSVSEELAAADGPVDRHWSVQPGIEVHGDARMLEVAMRNLLENAWKYTSHVASGEIRVYSEVSDGATWICIGDNGAGFDMTYAQKLFEPFQRLHRHDEFPGLGIGLATVQRILQRHGGEIRATSAPGVGATFRFSLPPYARGCRNA